MQNIPIQAVASQSFNVQLAGQNVGINLYQKAFGLFIDVYLNGSTTPLLAGVICQNLNRIIRNLYFGFIGDFCFIDSQGSSDPFYTGLGVRFSLAYLEAQDLPPNQG